MNQDTLLAIARAVREQIQPLIHDAIQMATTQYEDAAPDFSSAITWGTSSWHYSTNHIRRNLDRPRYPQWKMVGPRNSPCIQYFDGAEHYNLFFHRIGSGSTFSNPPNEKKVISKRLMQEQLMNASGPPLQLLLPGLKSKDLVLGWLGSPSDGMSSLYVCIPGDVGSKGILSWLDMCMVWAKDESQLGCPLPAILNEIEPLMERFTQDFTHVPEYSETEPNDEDLFGDMDIVPATGDTPADDVGGDL